MKNVKKAVIIASSIVFLLGASVGGFSFLRAPVSYISVDINPSVELGFNAMNQVVSVKGFNSDSNTILSGKNLTNLSVSDAVKTLIKSATSHGFIAADGSTVVSITTETDNKDAAAQLGNSALAGASRAVQESGDTIILHKDNVSLSLREKAENLGLTAGKYNLIEKLQALDPTISVNAYKDAKVTDIVNKINELEKTSNILDSGDSLLNVSSSTNSSSTSGNSSSSAGAVSSGVNNSSSGVDTEVLPVEQLPISLYRDEANVTFMNAHWGSVTAEISNQGVGGTNCIKYGNLLNNPYSPGPVIVFARSKNISNVKSTDRLQISVDIGTVTESQPVKVIFNSDPNIYVVTPNLNRYSGFEKITLDISGILDKLGGRISSLSFEGAGPNGWQGVSSFLVDDISIITPDLPTAGNTIESIQPASTDPLTLPIMIYNQNDNVTFCQPHWGSISTEVVNLGKTVIKFSNLKNNVYAQTPDIVFDRPKNISGISSLERLKISLNMGVTNYPQAIKVIINGSDETSVVTPKIESSSDFQDVYLDISAIQNKLGGQIAQIAFVSAAPNGFTNVDSLYIGQISIVKSPT